MSALVLVGVGWAVSVYGRPFLFAAGYAAAALLTWLVIGDGVAESVQGSLIAFGYCAGYFWLIDRYSSNVLVYLLVLFGGAVLWFVGPYWLDG